jgi:hypothetical protein
MEFPTTERFWHLYELEQAFLQLGRSITEEARYMQSHGYKCREMGRASGFFACATMIGDKINRLDRSIK